MKKLFAWFWRHRLDKEREERVAIITGWRSALIDDKFGGRKHVTFCGWFGQ